MGKRCITGNGEEMNMERVVSYTQIRVMEHKYFHFKCKRYDDLHDVLNGNFKISLWL